MPDVPGYRIEDPVILDDIPGKPGKTFELPQWAIEWVAELQRKGVVTIGSWTKESDAPSL